MPKKIRPQHRPVRRMSLRTKIIGWSFVPTAVILAIVAWATFNAYQQVTEDLVIERDQELTRLLANELAREMGKYIELLSMLRATDLRRDTVARSLVSEQVGSIVALRIEGSGSAYLVDANGQVIFHSDISRMGDDLSSQHVVQQVLSGQIGALRTRDRQGREIVASYSPVPGTGWGLITEESWERLIRSSQGYRQSLLLLLFLGVVTPSLTIAVGVRRMTRPIAELTGAAQELAGGNFDQTITANTGDELEDLAEQFNRMAAQLRDSYQDLERRVADRTKELTALNTIASTVNESLDLDQTLNRALDELLDLLGLEVGEIRLLDRERHELVIRTQCGLSPEFIQATDHYRVEETLPGRVLVSGQPVIYEDILGNPSNFWGRREGLRAAAICPLQAKEEQLGTLSLGTRHGPRHFSQNERELLRAVSDQVGVAIENAQLFEIEQRRAEQLQVINEVGQRIASILSVDELLEEIVHLVKETLGFYLVGIGLIEEDEIVIRTGAGRFWEDRQFRPLRLHVGNEGIVGWVATTGEPLLVRDVSQEPRYYSLPGAGETRSELAVPLKTKETTIGVLDVQSKRLNAFDEQDLTVLQSLARQAAIAIENARLYQQAQQLAVIEERTRLARDLHDSVTQSLYGVTLFAEAAGRVLTAGDSELAGEYLNELQHTAQDALQEMRLLIFELRPSILEENGLAVALQARLESVEARAGLETSLKVEGEDQRLPAEIEEGLYRIAQEALNNALKHAQAHHITVCLCHDQSTLLLEIADDGVGFEPSIARQQGGLGLRGMEERAAQLGTRLSIQSEPGAGTKVRVEVDQWATLSAS
jgi:nitrate/nitrite-specific signal transduction histidine kinase